MTLRRLLAPVFLVFFFCLFYWLLKRQGLEVQDLFHLNPWQVSAWLGLTVVNWWINSEKLLALLHHMQCKIRRSEAFQLSAASSVLNYLPFQAGATARGAYLKRLYQFPATRYVSLLLGTYVIMILSQSAIGFLVWLSMPKLPHTRILGVIFGMLLLFSLGVVFLRPSAANAQKRFFRTIVQIHEIFIEIFRDPRCLWTLVALEAALCLTETLRLKLSFYLLGFDPDLDLRAYVLMACMTIPSILLNVTPAGLGVRESAIALVAKAFGFKVEHAFLSASLDRVLTLVVIFTLGTVMTWNLLRTFTRRTAPGEATDDRPAPN